MSHLFFIKSLRSVLLLVLPIFLALPHTSLAEPTTPAIEPGFLNWYPREVLTPQELEGLPSFCRGVYRVPNITPMEGDLVAAESDSGHLTANDTTFFNGNVVIQQQDRIIRGDQAEWNQVTGYGQLTGAVSLTNPGLVLYGQRAEIDSEQGVAEFFDAQYSLPARHARGQASHITSYDKHKVQLKSATLTFCEPGQQDWDLATSTLNLNQETGMGSAWNTRLRIQNIPILYLPYYYFPLDDRRLTGFLDPNLSIGGSGQITELQLPFYINLHPQMDATITPHYVREHGTIIETQFRHLTKTFGEGEFNYALLNNDDTLDTKRWFINYKHQGRFGNHWQHRWVYNQVSDRDFLNDASPSEATDRSTHLPRRGEILWNKGHWHFDVTAEAFQTIDDNIALSARPYERMPQFNLTYLPVTFNHWQFQQRLQATRFTRDSERFINGSLQTLTGFNSLNGDRLLSDTSLSYPLHRPYGFVIPKVEYRVRSYEFNDYADTFQPEQESITIASPRYSVDAGLYFDRDIEWFNQAFQQTFEPRVYWAKSPYQADQEIIPNFDTAEITVTYNSLFTGERFTGDDRLADVDQISLGATTRFIRDDGLEYFRFSAGQIFYQKDRQVSLRPYNCINSVNNVCYNTNQNDRSSFMTEAEWNPSKDWSFTSTIEWDPYKSYAKQSRHSIRFEDGNNHILNLAYNEERNWSYNRAMGIEETKPTVAQIDAGIFWSLNDRWAVYGRALVDVRRYEDEEHQPYDSILESIVGIEYQNCCWRMQLSYRESSKDYFFEHNNQKFNTEKDYKFMFSIQLKGLGAMSKTTDTLLEESIPGYSRRIYHDY